MEITELLKIAVWALVGVTAFAVIVVGGVIVLAGRGSKAERERNPAYDEVSS